MAKMTNEHIAWLKENYGNKSRSECAKFLMVHISTVTKYVKMLNLEENTQKKATSKMDIGYCLDCKHYILGGNCAKTGRYTGALNEKICFKRK